MPLQHQPSPPGTALPTYTFFLVFLLAALASCQPSRGLTDDTARGRDRHAARDTKPHREPLFPGLLPHRDQDRDRDARTAQRSRPSRERSHSRSRNNPSRDRATTSRERATAERTPSRRTPAPRTRTRTPEVGDSGLKGEARLRAEIESYAEGFVGRPYQYGAKGPQSFDCSGFTSYVLKQFDIALLSSSMSQAKQGRSVNPRDAKPGDIVYFANGDGRVNHVGIVVDNGPGGLEIVHASTSQGIVRDNVTHSSYWSPRLAGARCVVDCRVGLVASY